MESSSVNGSDSNEKSLTKQAEEWKNIANEQFQKGQYIKSIDAYSNAIDRNPNCAIYYGNRSFAYSKLEQYGASLQDATKAIELDKSYVKAYYRRGSANLALRKYKEALKDFKRVVQIHPKNAEAREKLKNCEKIVKQIAFEDAIAMQEEEPISRTIDPNSIEIESSYDGPHMPQSVTLEFAKEMMQNFKLQKKLHTKYVYQILLEVEKMLSSLPTLLSINVPSNSIFNVCGDIHGQFYDLMNIFEINELPSETNPYLFNGDFVDRGSFSVEVILTLFVFKLLYPNSFHLLRGNHESLDMNRMYGFEGEVTSKYSKKMFDLFTEIFCWLPLAACLNEKVLVLHGGLFSKDGVTLKDIANIKRNRQPPSQTDLMVELLWSDPSPFPGRSPNKRGVGIAFGPDVTRSFLSANNLELLIRSHEVKDEGYLVEADGALITIFSAPNYCDTVGNKGALIKFNSDLKPSFIQFNAVPHPPIKAMAYASQFSMFL